MGFIFKNTSVKGDPKTALPKTDDGLFEFETGECPSFILPNGNILLNCIEFDNDDLIWFYKNYTRGYRLGAISDIYNIWSIDEIKKEHDEYKLPFSKNSFYFSDVCIWSFGILFEWKDGQYNVVADCGKNGMKRLANNAKEFVNNLLVNWDKGLYPQ